MSPYINTTENSLLTKEGEISTQMKYGFKVKDVVYIADSSYMTNQNGIPLTTEEIKSIHLNHKITKAFIITAINVPNLPCDYKFKDILGTANNCIIKDKQGIEYYCSHVNILKFKQKTF